jgi:hypothetical protein
MVNRTEFTAYRKMNSFANLTFIFNKHHYFKLALKNLTVSKHLSKKYKICIIQHIVWFGTISIGGIYQRFHFRVLVRSVSVSDRRFQQNFELALMITSVPPRVAQLVTRLGLYINKSHPS